MFGVGSRNGLSAGSAEDSKGYFLGRSFLFLFFLPLSLTHFKGIDVIWGRLRIEGYLGD